ncbi:hypothetical protein N5J07_17345 [Comamonas aquatica]|uniref:hypothetical protein n=1 Tax=Comamonadaceae TaxID=80864 RepID=UPI001A944D8C|nr:MULTISPECIES: hypothetical protein [Comamonadaceae]MBO0943401.1 hypothetical protein [Acidovorax temperans]MDH1381187.1 hypothetical protein [Comamonas aquatica]MDH1641264.1 hypothetical protein [Comamonas aquatica]
MATADDKQNGNATGFSGLSTLVSDVEDNRPANKPAPEVSTPPSAPPPPEPQPMRAEEAPAAPAVPQPPEGKSDSSSDVTTGKWMVGIGLGIGLLLIVFVNSSKHEPTRSTTPPIAQAPTTAVPDYQPPPPLPVTPRQEPAQKAVIQQSAVTESVDVLGQQVMFSNPSGYCTPGKSAREVELMDLARRSLGEGSRLVHAAVRCSELEDYRAGRRDMLDHWLQIQLLGPKGNFQRIEMPREAFLSSLSKSSPRVNAVDLNQRLKASFENSDISLSDMKIEPIGRDGNAVYFSMRMNMSAGETSRPISGISGITLLNSLPLSINVYEGTGSPQSRGRLPAIQQELLNSLLTEN